MRWLTLLALVILGCAKPGPALPVLCSPMTVAESGELVALPASSPLKTWAVFTDRNTCRANQSIYERLGAKVPPGLRRP
jgi:hypothetical protein